VIDDFQSHFVDNQKAINYIEDNRRTAVVRLFFENPLA